MNSDLGFVTHVAGAGMVGQEPDGGWRCMDSDRTGNGTPQQREPGNRRIPGRIGPYNKTNSRTFAHMHGLTPSPPDGKAVPEDLNILMAKALRR